MKNPCDEQYDLIVPAAGMSVEDRAEAYFRKGFNCSQSVFAAFADRYGIDERTALRLAASFGGGFGRMREVCGCVSGMAMVAGLETGSYTENNSEGKAYNYAVMQHLAEEYKKVSGGSIICRELLARGRKDSDEDKYTDESEQPTGQQCKPVVADTTFDGTAKPSERTVAYYKKRPCIQLVRDACTIIEREFGGKENE